MRRGLLPAALALALGAGALPAWGATQASLALQQVFGASAGSLVVAFGALDAMCVTPPATGVTCAPNVPANGATWYGAIQFRVRFTGAPAGTTVRLTGVRQAGGSAPSGSLVDGPSGVPTTSYPTSPAGAITLATALAGGSVTVQRSIGFRVLATDAGGSWVTSVVYSLIVE